MSIQESDNLFTIIQTTFFGCFKHILSWDNFYTFAVACYVPYFLGPSPSFSDFPVTFPPVPDHFRVFYDYFHPFSVSLCCLSDCSVIRPFRVFRLFPFISLFRLVSFQFSILGSDRSESGSLFLIRLHFCSATIPFSVDLRVLLSFDLMTSGSPSNYDPFSYCSILYINLASYVVIR